MSRKKGENSSAYRIDIWVLAFRLANVLNDCSEMWKLITNFEYLLQLGVIFYDDYVTLGAAGNELTCLRCICRVDATR